MQKHPRHQFSNAQLFTFSDPVLWEGSQRTLFFEAGRIPLFSSRDIVLGDIKVVNIIEDWEVLEEYAGEKLGFYQLLKRDGKCEIRVQTGRVGFVRQYDDLNDKELIEILDFCKKRRYIQISEHVRDEDFFK